MLHIKKIEDGIDLYKALGSDLAAGKGRNEYE